MRVKFPFLHNILDTLPWFFFLNIWSIILSLLFLFILQQKNEMVKSLLKLNHFIFRLNTKITALQVAQGVTKI